MDDDKVKDIKKDAKRIDEVGDILVVVHRASLPIVDTASVPKPQETLATAKVHEKALKGQAKSHTTS